MSTTLSCQCGQFQLMLTGAPFVAAQCHCTSCQKAAQRMASLGLAHPMASVHGGTDYALYRKDRVSFPNGTRLLEGHRLSAKAPTRRVITTCCKTPVFVEFNGGHWLSLYASLWPAATRPAPRFRTQVTDSASAAETSLPAGRWVTAKFYATLLGQWIAMGFRSPKLELTEVPPA